MQPSVITPPWLVLSPIRAAGIPPTITVALPLITLQGGPTQIPIVPIWAAGMPPISTFHAAGAASTPPTCGTGPVNIGQVCMSATRAAGCPMA